MSPNMFCYIKSRIKEYNGITYYTDIGGKRSFIFLRDGKTTVVPESLLEKEAPLYELYGISIVIDNKLR